MVDPIHVAPGIATPESQGGNSCRQKRNRLIPTEIPRPKNRPQDPRAFLNQTPDLRLKSGQKQSWIINNRRRRVNLNRMAHLPCSTPFRGGPCTQGAFLETHFQLLVSKGQICKGSKYPKYRGFSARHSLKDETTLDQLRIESSPGTSCRTPPGSPRGGRWTRQWQDQGHDPPHRQPRKSRE